MRTKLPAQATIAVVVAITIVFISVGALVSTISYLHYQGTTTTFEASRSFLLADSAIEEALLRLQRDSTYIGNNFVSEFGTATISVTNNGTNQRTLAISTQSLPVKRNISVVVSISGQPNVLKDYTIFAGENIQLVKSSAKLQGNLWSNDNVVLDNSTIVEGNVFAAGRGNGSFTSVSNGAIVRDNPLTPGIIEGNVSSIDRIRVNNSGFVQGLAKSKVDVNVNSGGSVGSSQIDPNLTINTIQIPTFKYTIYRQQAITAGTYYTTPAQFLNYLNLNGNTMSGGVHYIDSTSTLNFAQGTTYNLTGTIISNGSIVVESLNYTHNREGYLPVLVSKKDISFVDKSNCDCRATVNGVIFADDTITFKHDQYNGPLTYAVQINGAAWAGDQALLEDKSLLIVNQDLIENAEGFNFSETLVPPGTDNIINVSSWSIE